MAYSAKADILQEISEDELIGLTDDEGAGVVNDARVTAAIAKADALIDSYCGQVETVPFTVTPAIVKQHSVTISIYYIFGRRSAIPETRKQNYEDAIAHLKDIATGKASLPIVGQTTGGDEVQVSRDETDKIFNMGKTSDGSTGSLDNY